MFKKLLTSNPYSPDVALFVLRVATGCLMIAHGWPKLSRFSKGSFEFADPIGLGNELSLVLVIVAEVFCAFLLSLGLFTRLALIPLICEMFVVAFIVHANDPFNQQELALLYLVPFVTIFLTGPGRYSLDVAIRKR